MAAQLELEPLLQQIVDSASQLLHTHMGGLLVFDEQLTNIEYFKVSGWPGKMSGSPTGNGILGLALRERKPLLMDDVRAHKEFSGFPPGHPVVGPFLAAPLMAKQRSLGVLFVGNQPGGPVLERDAEELLVAFASQATVAIENARLYARSEELARLKERQRIAQALHNTVVQMLFSIGLEAEACLNILPPEDGLRQNLQTIRRLTARSSDELRSAIFALRSPFLSNGDGLVQLIQNQVNEFEALTGIPTTLIVMPCFPTLPPLISEAVYRIVCEAFSNIRKHAHAASVMVSLACDDETVMVIVQDDGVGLGNPTALDADDRGLHFGVATMRQITSQADGMFFIANNDDQGVMVKARFPLVQDV